MSVPANPVRYDPSMETPEENERQVDAEIVETMHKISETTLATHKHAIRSVHAKSHGLLYGTLTVHEGLPAVLAQGLFAEPASYPVVMRLSTTPGDLLDDNISTPRGLAVKVIGVAGARVDGSAEDVTQDFVLINGPVFSAPDAGGFLKSLKLLEPTTDTGEAWKKVASKLARGAEALVEAVGGQSPTLINLGGQPTTNILGETFYAAVPILYGDYIAKIAVAPVSPELTALAGAKLDNTGEPNALRNVVLDFFLQQGGTWELRVQLCTDLATMPVEDASVAWPEEESPYLAVATITVPAQDSWTIEKIAAIDEGLSFSPWHALAAHRPLGSVMRARKRAYEMSAEFRAEQNGREIKEPRRIEDLAG
jgi:hypothetical protein